MPEEGRKFSIVDGHWRDIMAITVSLSLFLDFDNRMENVFKLE
jgi:hypothetical protein